MRARYSASVDGTGHAVSFDGERVMRATGVSTSQSDRNDQRTLSADH